MNKERLFELAVSLAAANISAGQFQNDRNFETIVHDFTETAYVQLETIWKSISEDETVEGGPEAAGGNGSDVTH